MNSTVIMAKWTSCMRIYHSRDETVVGDRLERGIVRRRHQIHQDNDDAF